MFSVVKLSDNWIESEKYKDEKKIDTIFEAVLLLSNEICIKKFN